MMPTKAEVIENLNWVTERLSNRIWPLSVGVLATALAFIVESSKGTRAAAGAHGREASAGSATLPVIQKVPEIDDQFAVQRQVHESHIAALGDHLAGEGEIAEFA